MVEVDADITTEPVDGGGETQIIAVTSNQCLDVSGGSTTPGTNVISFSCNPTNPNQWFDVMPDKTLQWRNTNLCIAVNLDDMNLIIDDCSPESSLQLFEFREDRLFWDGERPADLPEDLVVGRTASIVEYDCYDDNQFLALFTTGSDGQLGSMTITYSIAQRGAVTVTNTYVASNSSPGNLNRMPRFGMQMVLPAGFERLAWYGRGPVPTYTDRRDEPLGIFETLVDDIYIEFPRPQESDNRVDTRWVSVTNDALGVGLMIQGHQSLSTSVSHYPRDTCLDFDYADSDPDKTANEYYWQCTKEQELYLNIDLVQMGVGGDNSWGYLPMSDYLLANENREYTFTFQAFNVPLNDNDDDDLGTGAIVGIAVGSVAGIALVAGLAAYATKAPATGAGGANDPLLKGDSSE